MRRREEASGRLPEAIEIANKSISTKCYPRRRRFVGDAYHRASYLPGSNVLHGNQAV
jgi:hypothetical protein